MQNLNVLLDIYAQLLMGHTAEAGILVRHLITEAETEETQLQAWVEERERLHGSSGWNAAQLRAQFEACSPLAEEEIPF